MISNLAHLAVSLSDTRHRTGQESAVWQLLLAAVPEFLGALAAAFVMTVAAWTWRRLSYRASTHLASGGWRRTRKSSAG
ncbi:hypothetical protein MBT84_49035 [Streptomyces sp. MBT84]|uniref:Uncharacterized protein n=1 Tax=Streptomyces lannensis TaxID=766498 RepID=A0ABP7KI87_9ACTN|nr:hypothetical protein [Streptomyces sp. MBT84]MBW8707610.1 hypothetical protein [Streptomyces sp. MBT84]